MITCIYLSLQLPPCTSLTGELKDHPRPPLLHSLSNKNLKVLLSLSSFIPSLSHPHLPTNIFLGFSLISLTLGLSFVGNFFHQSKHPPCDHRGDLIPESDHASSRFAIILQGWDLDLYCVCILRLEDPD